MDQLNILDFKLPWENEMTAQESEQFLQIFEATLVDASALFTDRARQRDINAPIFHKMPFGDFSFATFIYHKAVRLCQMMLSPKGVRESKIDDELIDIIVYCAAHMAWRILRQRQLAEQAAEDKAAH